MWAREMLRDWRSLGLPEFWERREVVRSMSRMFFRDSRALERRKGSARKAAMVFWRAVRVSRSRSGWRSQLRRRRPPMGVWVRSRTARSVCLGPERDSMRSRLRWEAESMRTCLSFSNRRGGLRCSQGRRSWVTR